MTTFQLLIVCFTAVTLSIVVAAAVIFTSTAKDDSPAAAPTRVSHRVTVHTKTPDDRTIFGVVVADYADRMSLENAEYVTALGGQAMAGRQDIAKADIAWVDVHGLVADLRSVEAKAA